MSGGEKALRFAARALGGGTLLGAWVALADYRWIGGQAVGETAALLGVALLLLLALALGMKRCRRSGYGPALGRTAMTFLSGVATGVAIGVLLLLLAELLTAAVGLMMLKGYGG